MATISKVSEKYKDIIHKSTLIHSGSPALYQLTPKEEKIGTLTRKTVGEKNVNKVNRNILLVGDTGTGKSTLINALFNYAMGVKFEDDIWFEIVEGEKRSQSESQTSDVVVYEIFDFKENTLPFSLTIIDTPGFGDTRGIEHDVIISQRLFDLFRSEAGVHELSAVGLVMKAPDKKLSDRPKYIFDSVMSLFGNDMKNNIVALITHSTQKELENPGILQENSLKALDAAKIKCARNQKNQPVYFLFDNQQSSQRTEETQRVLESASKITMSGLSQFKDFLEKLKPQKLKITVEELNSRIRLTACIQNLQERIQLIELKQTEIRQIEEALKEHEHTMKNDKLTVQVDEVYKDRETIKGGKWWLFFYERAVTCKICEENCHYPGCTMSPKDCDVMKDGHCTVCTNKCPVSDHVKETWRYVIKTKKILMTVEEIKKRHGNMSQSEKSESLLENLEKEIEKLTADKTQCLEESYKHVVTLDQIGLNVDSLSTHVHLDFLIEKMKEKEDTEKIKKLEEMRGQEDEATRAVLQHKINNITSKYKDFISKSSLICSGSPVVYQLTPNIKQIGTLTRKTVGEKNLDTVNKTILLVGETGTGKSSLINALVNRAMGVKFEDKIWFKIVEEEKRRLCWSQTSDVIMYDIFGVKGQTLPFSLTIIDTPGFGDTRGIEHDVIISQRLFDLFRSKDGVHELSAVGLVVKASVNRLSDRLMYIFDSVMSLFGNDMEKNIVALITHSDGLKPKNALEALDAADIKCARDEKNQPVYFLFDNKQTIERTEMTQRTQRSERALKHAWETTHDEMDQFTEFLEASTPQKLMTTVEVLNLRIRLTACIQNLQERVEFIELKQTVFKQTQEALKKHEDKMKKNEKFIVEADEVYKEKETIKGGMWGLFYGAVTCKICEENCHYPGCTMAWYPKHCEVMKGGCCTSCTNKCPASDHVKEKRIYVNKTRKVEKTLQDMKAKYEENKTESEKKLSLLENLEKEMEKLMANKDQCLEEAYQHVVRLDQIALNVNSVSTHVDLGFLIEKMMEKGDTEKIKKLEKVNSQVDEGNMAAVRYVYGRLTTAGKGIKKRMKNFTEQINKKM